MKVGLDWEPEVRGLHPESLADTLNLASHAALVFQAEEVLDHRIAECNVKALIVKLTQIRCVACYRMNITVSFRLGIKVHSCYLSILTARPATVFPKGVCSADVQNP